MLGRNPSVSTSPMLNHSTSSHDDDLRLFNYLTALPRGFPPKLDSENREADSA